MQIEFHLVEIEFHLVQIEFHLVNDYPGHILDANIKKFLDNKFLCNSDV